MFDASSRSNSYIELSEIRKLDNLLTQCESTSCENICIDCCALLGCSIDNVVSTKSSSCSAVIEIGNCDIACSAGVKNLTLSVGDIDMEMDVENNKSENDLRNVQENRSKEGKLEKNCCRFCDQNLRQNFASARFFSLGKQRNGKSASKQSVNKASSENELSTPRKQCSFKEYVKPIRLKKTKMDIVKVSVPNQTCENCNESSKQLVATNIFGTQKKMSRGKFNKAVSLSSKSSQNSFKDGANKLNKRDLSDKEAASFRESIRSKFLHKNLAKKTFGKGLYDEFELLEKEVLFGERFEAFHNEIKIPEPVEAIDEDYCEFDGSSSSIPKLRAGVIPCLKRLDTLSDLSPVSSYVSHVSKTADTSDESNDLSTISTSMSSCNLSDSDWVPSSDQTTSTEDESGDESNIDDLKELSKRKLELLLQSPLVKDVFGIELAKMYLVDVIAKETGIKKTHILICLQKMKQNLPFNVLGFDYGMSRSYCGRVFKKSISVVAKAVEKFVVWSDKEVILHRLPIAFRANFKDVVSIIDCFEIEIQQPSNAVHQSHTWSNYYKCNTVKFLVSCTPDGIINFISEGFGGRITDLEIVSSSGYLNVLPNNSVVMADRGFKNIESVLQDKGCRLVRPPSVTAGTKMTKDEVRATRQVAALRIHIERVIRRYRDFAMLRPHATVNINLISSLNEVVQVASALVNIQNALIR